MNTEEPRTSEVQTEPLRGTTEVAPGARAYDRPARRGATTKTIVAVLIAIAVVLLVLAFAF